GPSRGAFAPRHRQGPPRRGPARPARPAGALQWLTCRRRRDRSARLRSPFCCRESSIETPCRRRRTGLITVQAALLDCRSFPPPAARTLVLVWTDRACAGCAADGAIAMVVEAVLREVVFSDVGQ